jgi:hypothetical protein
MLSHPSPAEALAAVVGGEIESSDFHVVSPLPHTRWVPPPQFRFLIIDARGGTLEAKKGKGEKAPERGA